jgi:hypothetical protein
MSVAQPLWMVRVAVTVSLVAAWSISAPCAMPMNIAAERRTDGPLVQAMPDHHQEYLCDDRHSSCYVAFSDSLLASGLLLRNPVRRLARATPPGLGGLEQSSAGLSMVVFRSCRFVVLLFCLSLRACGSRYGPSPLLTFYCFAYILIRRRAGRAYCAYNASYFSPLPPCVT